MSNARLRGIGLNSGGSHSDVSKRVWKYTLVSARRTSSEFDGIQASITSRKPPTKPTGDRRDAGKAARGEPSSYPSRSARNITNLPVRPTLSTFLDEARRDRREPNRKTGISG